MASVSSMKYRRRLSFDSEGAMPMPSSPTVLLKLSLANPRTSSTTSMSCFEAIVDVAAETRLMAAMTPLTFVQALRMAAHACWSTLFWLVGSHPDTSESSSPPFLSVFVS